MTQPKIFGHDPKEAYEKFLAGKLKSEAPKPNPVITPASVENPKGYIILPGHQHGSYEYPDLLVATERSHLNENWNNIQSALHSNGEFMLTIRQFADFLILLKSGDAHDGSGRKIPAANLTSLLNEITEVRAPYRAEWLDAKFSNKGKNRHIQYHSINPDDSLTLMKLELEDHLLDDKTPGISLDDWLSKATSQGLPAKNTQDGLLYYWHPREDRVAWFVAGAAWAYLVCFGGPALSGSGLGVRAARVKK